MKEVVQKSWFQMRIDTKKGDQPVYCPVGRHFDQTQSGWTLYGVDLE
jgi:hypothetical protein